jgi:SRSO17 transposase
VLGDQSGVLVVDETGFVKKGSRSVGVARQYSGAAGRIENSQIGVFLAYASRHGHALIDRRLYLPETWASDEARRKAAGVPPDVDFATKPAMARAMIAAALDAGVRSAWVLADAVYGDYRTRRMLEDRSQPYVLAVRSNHTLRMITQEGLLHTDPAQMAGAAGLRWTIEECFLRAKDDLGLDHCEARSWHGWHRHMTLVMAAAAFLTKLAADLRRAAALADQIKANETSPTSV